MRFKSGEYEIVIDSDEGFGFAIGKDHMFAGYVVQTSNYHYIEEFKNDSLAPINEKEAAELIELDHDGRKYTLEPSLTRAPIRVDKFAAVALDSLNLADSLDMGIKLNAVSEGEIPYEEGVADLEWCTQVIQQKFGGDVEPISATEEIVKDLPGDRFGTGIFSL